MSRPLMPKATAVWLVENTTLTFDQIAEFCGLHPLEIQAIADGDVAIGITGKSPVMQGILTVEDIKAGEADPKKSLVFVQNDVPEVQRRAKGPRYTAITKRAEKPDGIAYLIKNYPQIPDAQIIKLLGTTKNTIDSIRNRTNANMSNIKPTDPVQLGLCSRFDLDALIRKLEAARLEKEKKGAKKSRAGKKTAKADENAAESSGDNDDAEQGAEFDAAESTGMDAGQANDRAAEMADTGDNDDDSEAA